MDDQLDPLISLQFMADNSVLCAQHQLDLVIQDEFARRQARKHLDKAHFVLSPPVQSHQHDGSNMPHDCRHTLVIQEKLSSLLRKNCAVISNHLDEKKPPKPLGIQLLVIDESAPEVTPIVTRLHEFNIQLSL